MLISSLVVASSIKQITNAWKTQTKIHDDSFS